MVGGTFLNRAHFDLIYHVMALCACLDRILTHELTVQATDEDAAPGVETTEEAAA
jgi:hypothetical protein